MATFRTTRTGNFTTIQNAIVHDPALSLHAKGLLVIMLSFPPDWDHSLKQIQKMSSTGREAHQSAMKNLIEAGYVVRTPVRKPDGTMGGWQYEVYDAPQSDRRVESPTDGFPAVGNPTVGNPAGNTKTIGTKTSESYDSDAPEPKQVKPPEKAKGFGPVIGAAMGAWEDKRHPAWPALDRMTSRGAKYVKEFWNYYDRDTEKACEMMQLAIAWAVEREDWWRQSKSPPTFDEMAANNKLEGYAEKAAHARKEEEPAEVEDKYLGKRVKTRLGYFVILKEVHVPNYRYVGSFEGETDPDKDVVVYASDIERIA